MVSDICVSPGMFENDVVYYIIDHPDGLNIHTTNARLTLILFLHVWRTIHHDKKKERVDRSCW
jgi:hypothetical protein